jgi:hypothetical protein
MPSIPKKILVVAHDPALKDTRAALLKHAGYDVTAVETPKRLWPAWKPNDSTLY